MSEVGNRNTCGQASPSSPTLHASPAVLQSWAPRRVSAYQTCEAISKQRRTLSLQVLSDGHVYFTNEGKQRPSADAALEHPFLAPAFNPDLTPEELAEGTTSTGSRNWLGLFSLVQNRVTDLEDEISKTVRLLPTPMLCRESSKTISPVDTAHIMVVTPTQR